MSQCFEIELNLKLTIVNLKLTMYFITRNYSFEEVSRKELSFLLSDADPTDKTNLMKNPSRPATVFCFFAAFEKGAK